MRIALFITAALIAVSLALQLAYARAYAANATRSTKVVWGVNIGLLVAVLGGLLWYAFAGAVK